MKDRSMLRTIGIRRYPLAPPPLDLHTVSSLCGFGHMFLYIGRSYCNRYEHFTVAGSRFSIDSLTTESTVLLKVKGQPVDTRISMGIVNTLYS